MPEPVSLTRTMFSPLPRNNPISTCPPAGVNLTALSTRLANASISKSRSPWALNSCGQWTRRAIPLSSAIGSYMSPTSRTRSASATLPKPANLWLFSISASRKIAVMIDSDWSIPSIGNRLQLLQRPGVAATPLERQPHTRERCAQVMSDVIANACKGVDESFHLVEHAIDHHRKFGEGIVGLPMRESFAQVAGDNALNSLVDLYDALPGTGAQRHTDRKAKKHGGNQTKRERLANDACDFADFADISANPQPVPVRQIPRDQADRLPLSATLVYPVDHSALYGIIGPKIGW